MRNLILLIGLSLTWTSVSAQTAEEAARYTSEMYGSTAKSLGMAGAFGALAGDYTGVKINPAVVGTYRTSEFSMTAALHNQHTNTYFNSQVTGNDFLRFNLPNMNFVGHFPTYEDNGLLSHNWSIGYGSKDFYYHKASFIGEGRQFTILDKFLEELNGGAGTDWTTINSTYPYSSALAWEGYLVNTLGDNDSNHYEGIYDGGMSLAGIRTVKGAKSEMTLAYGGNYDNKFYYGFSIGIPSISYEYTNVYSEVDEDNFVDDFNSFELTERINSSALGIYLQGGVIFQPSNWMRLASSYRSPTAYSFTDKFQSEISSNFNSATYNHSTPFGSFDYALYTPGKWTNSVAFISKIGLLNIDWDRVDYSSANFDMGTNSDNLSDWFYGNGVNTDIKDKYTVANNFRIGTEIKLLKLDDGNGYQSLRMGYAHYGNSAFTGNNSRTIYSLGTGVKFETFFADFGLSNAYSEEESDLYVLENVDAPSIKRTFEHMQAMFTIGWRF